MNPQSAVKTLALCVSVCMVLGAVIGGLLGLVSPGFLIGMVGEEILLDGPVRAGIALGLVNGLIFGFATGVLLVIIAAFGKRS